MFVELQAWHESEALGELQGVHGSRRVHSGPSCALQSREEPIFLPPFADDIQSMRRSRDSDGRRVAALKMYAHCTQTATSAANLKMIILIDNISSFESRVSKHALAIKGHHNKIPTGFFHLKKAL